MPEEKAMTPNKEPLPPRVFAHPALVEEANLTRKMFSASVHVKVHQGDIEYLSLQEHTQILQEKIAEARAEAFDAAVNEVSEWMILQQKAFDQGGFSFPKEAEREHGNTMRLLACIQNSILKAAGREDEAIRRIKSRMKAARSGKGET